jgi:hypothetical protein
VEIDAARNGELPFSYCSEDVRPGRAHYHLSGARETVPQYCKLAKPKPKRLQPSIRKKRLGVLRECASLFKPARVQRVTSRGRERSGTLPARSYEQRVDTSSAPLPVLQGSKLTGHTSSSGAHSQGASSSADSKLRRARLHKAMQCPAVCGSLSSSSL